MAPISSFATTEWTRGPAKLERFNGVPSMQTMGAPAPGVSTGEAMKAMEEIAAKLPAGVGYEWNGITYEDQPSCGPAPATSALPMLTVFLCLAGRFVSVAVPIALMLVVTL